MNHFVVARRADDSVISVQQDNTLQSLTISNINKPAETLLEYSADELLSKSLLAILNKNVTESINSYLEYTDDGADLFDVLSKISNFSLVGKNNNVIAVKPKVFRTATCNKNIINYEILIRDTSISQKLDTFRKHVLGNTKYSIHPVFNIIDETSTNIEIKVVLDFLNKNDLRAVMCMIQVDPPHNNSSIEALTKNTIDLLHKNIRDSDITGYTGDYKVVCILLGCKSEHAYSAISRLHRAINDNLKNFYSTVSIGYAQMYNKTDATQILNNINNTLFIAQQENSGGSIKTADI
ncbi:MAG: GGDEF domain-containing protein [Ehrlichia sp.]